MNFPTILTVFRMVLSIIFFVFVIIPEDWAKITALVIFIIAAVTDRIDGHLARKNKEVTDLGAFLDPLADKMLVNLAFLALVYLNVIPVWIFAIILVRDFVVDGLRMALAKKHKTLPASTLGKYKTTTQMITLIIFLANLIFKFEPLTIIGNIFLCIAIILTVLSATDYFIKNSNKL